jgi:hypothetical protein
VVEVLLVLAVVLVVASVQPEAWAELWVVALAEPVAVVLASVVVELLAGVLQLAEILLRPVVVVQFQAFSDHFYHPLYCHDLHGFWFLVKVFAPVP